MALWTKEDLNLALTDAENLNSKEADWGVECLGNDIGVGANTGQEMGSG